MSVAVILPSGAGELYVPAEIEVKEKKKDAPHAHPRPPKGAEAAPAGLDTYAGAPESPSRIASHFDPIIHDEEIAVVHFSRWVADPDIEVGEYAHSIVLQEEIEARRRAEAEAEGPEDILEAARTEGERLKEEARKQGFDQGHREGEAKALDEALEKLRPTLEGFIQNIQELTDYRAEVLQMAEQEVFELAMLVGRKVIGAEVRLHPDVVLEVVRNALKRAVGWGKATLQVHPEDYALIEETRGRIEANIEAVTIAKIEPNPEVGRGGCILESNFGEVDARLEHQVEEVESELRRFLEKNMDRTAPPPPEAEPPASAELPQGAAAPSPDASAEPLPYPPEVQPFRPPEFGEGGKEAPSA